MTRFVAGSLLALALAAGTAVAQTQTTPPAASSSDAEMKFKAADKNNTGSLEGAEVEPFKGKLTQIDANKDGKVSRDEYSAATKAGHIK
jgi:hypothetical protein